MRQQTDRNPSSSVHARRACPHAMKANYQSTQTCKWAKDVRVPRLDRLDPVEKERCKRLRHGEARHCRSARPGNGHVPCRRLAISVELPLELDGSARRHVRLTFINTAASGLSSNVQGCVETRESGLDQKDDGGAAGTCTCDQPQTERRHVFDRKRRRASMIQAWLSQEKRRHAHQKSPGQGFVSCPCLFSAAGITPFESSSCPPPLSLLLFFSGHFPPRLVCGEGFITFCTLGSRSRA